MENQRKPYEKAAGLFAKNTNLSSREKAQYRNLAGKIADIYAYKKTIVTNKPDEKDRYETAEKHWNDLYDSIK